MMRLTISAVAVAALIMVAISLPHWRSPSIALSLSTAAMPPLEDLHTMAGVNTLPVQDIEDQSLVYPTATKR